MRGDEDAADDDDVAVGAGETTTSSFTRPLKYGRPYARMASGGEGGQRLKLPTLSSSQRVVFQSRRARLFSQDEGKGGKTNVVVSRPPRRKKKPACSLLHFQRA